MHFRFQIGDYFLFLWTVGEQPPHMFGIRGVLFVLTWLISSCGFTTSCHIVSYWVGLYNIHEKLLFEHQSQASYYIVAALKNDLGNSGDNLLGDNRGQL